MARTVQAAAGLAHLSLLTRLRAPGLQESTRPRACADTTAGAFFERVGDLLVTGPTLTNVNDFRAVLIAH